MKNKTLWKFVIQTSISMLSAIWCNQLYVAMRNIDLIVVHCSATRCNRRYSVMQLIRDYAEYQLL